MLNQPGALESYQWVRFLTLACNDKHYILVVDLSMSTEEELMKPLETILVYSIRCLFVDNAEIYDTRTLNITPSCKKILPNEHKIFVFVTHTHT